MIRKNCTTTLKRRTRGHPMRTYDTLPPDLRAWLATAVLPWSAASALKVWSRALRRTRGDRTAALRAVADVEHRLLQRDVARIWGTTHPYLHDTAS